MLNSTVIGPLCYMEPLREKNKSPCVPYTKSTSESALFKTLQVPAAQAQYTRYYKPSQVFFVSCCQVAQFLPDAHGWHPWDDNSTYDWLKLKVKLHQEPFRNLRQIFVSIKQILRDFIKQSLCMWERQEFWKWDLWPQKRKWISNFVFRNLG